MSESRSNDASIPELSEELDATFVEIQRLCREALASPATAGVYRLTLQYWSDVIDTFRDTE